MRFADPAFFLLLIPVFFATLLYWLGKCGRDPTLKFSDVSLVRQAGGRGRGFRRFARGLIRLAAITLAVMALARPQTGTGEEKKTQWAVDIVIALDVSGSMATLDFQPDNRLVAAKMEAKRFIEGRQDDRIGLVIFAGQSFTQCPLTFDHTAILTLLDKIQLGMVQDGTAIGLGLGNAVNRLKDSEARSKIVILLTDGINNTGEIDPITAADLAKQYGIRVYTIGVGKEGIAYLPVNDPRFGTRLIKVETQIDEKMLNDISAKTGGHYFRARDERMLHDIFRQIDLLEKTEVTVEQQVHYEERYFWFLWPAFLLVLAEMVLFELMYVKIP